jgi:putative transposase
MFIQYPSTIQISKLVNNLKSVKSRRIRNQFLDLRGSYVKPVLWSRSYFSGSCSGTPLKIIKQYIQNQQG